MDLIDREGMMNYVRRNKINIGQVAHIVIMKQKPVNAVGEEVYTREYNLRKDAEMKVYKLEKAIDDIKAEIYEALDMYEPTESQNHFDGGLSFALEIINKHMKEGDA